MEKLVKIAARLYECRDTAKQLLGDKYLERMKLYGEWIRKVSESRKIDDLAAAKEIINTIGTEDGMVVMHIIAAAVELIEPSTEAIS